MTKAQRREHKIGNARRRYAILRASYKQKLGENVLVWLGGVGQRSKYSAI